MPERLLRAAVGDAEAGDDLVEHEQRADAVALGAQALEEPVVGRDQPHVGGDRLDDDARGVAVELGHRLYGATTVSATAASVTPGRAGEAEGGEAAARLGEEQVAVAVVVAGELHDLAVGRCSRGPPGSPTWWPRCPDDTRRTSSTDGHPGADRLGQLHLALGGGAVGRAVGGRPLHRLDDRRVGVAGDDGAVGLDEVDVAAALDVPHVGALGPGHEVRRAADALEGAHRAVDPAGDHPLGPLEQLRRCVVGSRRRVARRGEALGQPRGRGR